MRGRRLAAVALIIALAGCSDPAADATSSAGGECDEAFDAAGSAVLPGDREDLLRRSLTSCRDAAEWTATSTRHPRAMEGQDAATWLRTACADAPSTPVCGSRD